MADKISPRISQSSSKRQKWIRQEYKSNKDKFERAFKISFESGDPPHNTHVLTLEQSYSALGTTVWDGSIALAKMFENNPRFPETYLQKCNVLELGAGCGLVGISLSLLGVKTVVLSDLELCIPTLQRNVDRNILGLAKECIQVVPFTWGQDPSALALNGKFDIVVAAEVLYDEEDSKLLALSASQLLAQPHGIMFVSMGRNRKGETSFVKAMAGHGFSANEVSTDKLHPSYQDEIIKVIELTDRAC